MAKLRDSDMRCAVVERVRQLHPAAFVVREMQIVGFRSYVDIAAIDGSLHGFEIKSDVDSMARLSNQVRQYDLVCDTSTIVTTERHLARAIAIVPEHWGVFSTGGDAEGAAVRVVREAQPNGRRSDVKLFEMLTREEIAAALRAAGFGRPVSNMQKIPIVDAALEFFGPDASKRLALEVLRTRRTWTCRQLGVDTDTERIAHALRQANPFSCLTTNQTWWESPASTQS